MLHHSSNDSPVWVDNPETFNEMLAPLRASPLVAVDTESDSLHVYFEKVCLLQFSIPGADYLVDPLRVDLTPLGDLFASEGQEKVFHAAEYDILCLKRDYGFTFANLFDTMIAARILGWSHFGLGPILQERFDVQLDKRLQRYDWGTRPLPASALDYARLDTHHLLSLRALQLQELQTRGRLTEAREAFRRRACVAPPERTFDPEGFWRLPGARELDPPGQALLRQLYIFRDDLARELDVPPFKVMPNVALLRLATDRPSSRRALARIRGLSYRINGRHADEVLKVIVKGLQSPPPAYPNHALRQPSEATVSRYEALRAWRKSVADARRVEPGVILSNQALMELARRVPRTPDGLEQVTAMDDWQRQTYGDEVLQVLRRQAVEITNDDQP